MTSDLIGHIIILSSTAKRSGKMRYLVRESQYREIIIEADTAEQAEDLASLRDDQDWDYSDFSETEVEAAE